MARFRAVFFDLDGTLWDKAACSDYAMEIVLPDLMAHLPNLDRDEILLEFNAMLLDSVLEGGIEGWQSATRTARFEKLLQDCGVHKEGLARDLSKKYEQAFWFSMRGFLRNSAPWVLQQLRERGLVVGVITNGSPAAQRHVLEGLGLEEHLDHIVISEVEGMEKPDARLFKRALALADCEPPEMLYIGDSLITDVLGASRAAVPVAWLKEPEQELQEGLPAPDFIIEDLRQVLAIVDSPPPADEA